jgi:transcription-repair coupling factor (superfamily II helicase)
VSFSRLTELLRNEPAMTSMVGSSTGTVAVSEAAQAYFIAGLRRLSAAMPLMVVVPTVVDAERLAADLRIWAGESSVEVFPAWETLPFERVSPSTETMGKRMRAMWHLRQSSPERGGKASPDAPSIFVAPVKALLQRLGPHVEDVDPLIVTKGSELDPAETVNRLVAAGYRRDYQVEARGDVAVRGSIIDVFPSTGDAPVRIDLWGDEVDRLTEFSLTDQRSTIDIDAVELVPCRELLPTDEVRERASKLIGAQPWARDRWEKLSEGMFFDGMESWLPWLAPEEHLLTDLLPDSAQVLMLDPKRTRDRAADLLSEEESLASSLAETWGARTDDSSDEFPKLHLDFDRLLSHTKAPIRVLTSVPDSPSTPVVEAGGWAGITGDASKVASEVTRLLNDKYSVIIAAEGEASAVRMSDALREQGLSVPIVDESDDLSKGGARVVVMHVERGFYVKSAKVAVITESDVSGRRRSHRQVRKPRKRVGEAFFDDLVAGDYVVHHHHGVGKYQGMVKRNLGGSERDYLLLEYRGDDKLYVPSDQIDAIRPYTGGESPSLHRLGGTDFGRAKAKVREAVTLIAQELVVLYQKRTHSPGYGFAQDSPWQKELEESFPFQETVDQLKAIDEVKTDMEQPIPMDRLVCGDVGFGKTEVAIRAVFKAIQDGKQAAILVPTTLLAHQHFATFSDRFAGYPVRVEVLSRFLTSAQAKKVVNAIKDGEVDVVIGTHKLLSDSLKFKNLGLLVVDEEQRFGVTHKESIKQLQQNVDVLTLSATPIPRTLEMSLTGIRDLTILNTPPAERQPILTYVGEFDDKAVAESIRRELLREGQMFFVHNRIQDIDRVAAHLNELVPEARIAVAHGKMDEGALEQIVIDFWEHNYDVLVSTTIIESGIDMPTVNTLVVDRADRLGLGQLHQLRGRVGRSGQRAYAYLFYPPEVELSEQAHERLKTIGENTALGSGFKIAMRDLEIRGAGNLLGGTQSGHIAAVGYDLYVQMVTEAVAELKGEPMREPAEIKLELPLAANLSSDYIGREDLRLEAYRRLATVASQAEVDDVAQEWLDRFGPPPPEAEALLKVGRLRAECVRTGVREVTVSKDVARLAPLALKPSASIRLKRLYPNAVVKEDLDQIVLPMPKKSQFRFSGASAPSKAETRDIAEILIEFLQEMVPEDSTPVASPAS